ncbi:hypothetical protein [Enemella sp. A6]|uniref:hypothetical protein n=1 Tax=Enemella sp. A6 TaxID=3440152 RepID=UPI003EBBF80E
MTIRTLRLFEDRLLAGAKPIYLPRGDRAIYVRSGECDFVTDSRSQFAREGHAVTEGDQVTLINGTVDTVLWRWELADGDDLRDEDFHLRSAPQAETELKIKADFEFDDRYDWLMRCDTVTFPPGGIAWTHLHQGPGIRITLNGEITIETEGERHTHPAGSPWVEKGVLPVFAPTTEEESTTFVRCFILPSQLKGVSSIRIVYPQDWDKPNMQQYRVLCERIM